MTPMLASSVDFLHRVGMGRKSLEYHIRSQTRIAQAPIPLRETLYYDMNADQRGCKSGEVSDA